MEIKHFQRFFPGDYTYRYQKTIVNFLKTLPKEKLGKLSLPFIVKILSQKHCYFFLISWNLFFIINARIISYVVLWTVCCG